MIFLLPLHIVLKRKTISIYESMFKTIIENWERQKTNNKWEQKGAFSIFARVHFVKFRS